MNQTAPFKIYNASAGSGKTFTLTKNYISRLLLSKNPAAYKNILAITFTNKAVAEMKSRIIHSLRAFSQDSVPEGSQALYQQVKQKTGLSDEAIQTKSYSVLRNILHNYAAFDVSTIDGFTHRILQTFAKDLRIPMNFEVELETDEILEEAVDSLIAQAGKDNTLTRALVDFALAKADDDKSWDITKDLNDIARLITVENNFGALDQLKDKNLQDFARFETELRKEIAKLKTKCTAQAGSFFKILKDNDLKFKDFTGSFLPKFMENIKNRDFPLPEERVWQRKLKEGKKIYPDRVGKTPKGPLIDELQPQIAKIYETVEPALIRLIFLKRILRKTPALSLLTAIEKEVSQIKDERGILLISEFNKTISESIKNQPVPFIYERLGERYQTFFIDEFQDTSELQWENLKPLIGNTLASEGGSLALIGDVKQSIYRWRGGKAEQFMDLSRDINPFHVKKYRENLPKNFRSLPEIVLFNNAFFTHAAQYLQFDPYRQLFENAEQSPALTDRETGYVNINFIEANNREEEDQVYPEKVFQTLNRLRSKGHPLKDICILVRKKVEGVAIADFLNEKEIPLISSQTLLLKKSPKVQFIIALLQFALNPSEANLKFDILNFLYDQLSKDESFYQFVQPKLNYNEEDFFKALKAYGFNFSLKTLHQLPVYDGIEYILRRFQLIKAHDAYIQFFLDFVYEYSQQHTGGIPGLLDLWKLREDKLSITAPEGTDAVQIMTIHKAKGLEFPVVIYPYANNTINDTKQDNIWVELEEETYQIPLAYLSASSKMEYFGEKAEAAYNTLLKEKELDTMNMVYVAMTRAAEQLYIISKKEFSKGKEKHNKLSGMLIHFLKEKALWQKEKSEYEFGEIPSAKPWEPEGEDTQPADDTFISSAPKSHNINVVTKSGELWETPQQEAIDEGNIIHDLLREISEKDDVPNAIEHAILQGLILKDETEKYTEKLNTIVNHPDLTAYFSNTYTIYTEKEIIANHEYKRLDRLCLAGNAAVIIDYKTGTPRSPHQNQIRNYAQSIQEMGYTVKEKLLVYMGKDAIKIDKVA